MHAGLKLPVLMFAGLLVGSLGCGELDPSESSRSQALGPIIFHDLGTAAPPGTVGGVTMTPFPPDERPLGLIVPSVSSPLGGQVIFSGPVRHLRVGAGWATWSHGYQGDVYSTNGATAVTLILPPGTAAYYLYVEPDPFAIFNFTVTARDGTVVGTVTLPVNGLAGARGFAFTELDGSIQSITVSSSVAFAVGELGIAAQPPASRCDQLEALAAAISLNSMIYSGTPRLTRDQYLALFEAVECETGVPAKVLKAFAFNESFGKYYRDDVGADTYPRHFIEPCDQISNLNGWGYPGEIFPRYYGRPHFPLFIFPPHSSYVTTPLPPPVAPQRPTPGPGCVPLGPSQPSQWANVWPGVVHVIAGDDGVHGNEGHTKGIGIAATTFNNKDIRAAAAREGLVVTNTSSIGNEYQDEQGQPQFYPIGGRPSTDSRLNNIASSPTLWKVVKDAHYNIRLLAELTLYKYEYGPNETPKSNAKQLVEICQFPQHPQLGQSLCGAVCGPGEDPSVNCAPPPSDLATWIDLAAMSKTFGKPTTKQQWCNACGITACTHVAAAECLLTTYTTPPSGPACRDPIASCETNKAQRFVSASAPLDLSTVPTTVGP